MGGAVNACHPDSATDMRGQMQVTVRFGGALGFSYDPACFRVSPGTQVTFSGEFDQHPLVGGEVSGGMKVPDPSSPFGGPTSSGTSKTVMLQATGTFPFYCNIHALIGMKGAAFVAP
jgi:plastocyanin